MYIVNWYPGSYGDRIIKDLFDIEFTVTESDIYRLPYDPVLKYPETYQLTDSSFKLKVMPLALASLKNFGVIGAHRLSGLDFTQYFKNIKVVSIDPGNYSNIVSENFFKKVQGVRPEHDNPIVKYLLNKNQNSTAEIYKQKLILDWKRDNILETDIVFSLNRYIEDINYCNWFKKHALP